MKFQTDNNGSIAGRSSGQHVAQPAPKTLSAATGAPAQTVRRSRTHQTECRIYVPGWFPGPCRRCRLPKQTENRCELGRELVPQSKQTGWCTKPNSPRCFNNSHNAPKHTDSSFLSLLLNTTVILEDSAPAVYSAPGAADSGSTDCTDEATRDRADPFLSRIKHPRAPTPRSQTANTKRHKPTS